MEIQQKQERFSQEYSELFDYIYRYIHYRVSHVQDSEDIVSDIFESSYANLHAYDPVQGSLKQWITGFARNKVLMYWRDKKLEIPVEEIEKIPDVDPGLDAGIDSSIFVQKVLQDLSLRTRALLAMRFVDGMTYEEIAQATDKQPDAVRQYFSRLYKKLRLSFREE